ncbi:MAG: hypothetical protein LIO80_01110 [Lachnospiraceae bacterium]|nr:hypothetical protein [Lachnospiraceae bacterium]
MLIDRYKTNISRHNLEEILHRDKTPAEIIDFLQRGAVYRSFSEVLQLVYPADDLREKLKSGLIRIAGAEDSAEQARTIGKSVRNWLDGGIVPKNREQLFKICFALELSEEDADYVFRRASETGIHYRNPQELVYAFALRTGLSWAEAEALDAEMAEIYEPLASEAAGKRKEEWTRREREFREQRKAEMNRIKAIRDDSRRKRYGQEFKEVYIASVRKNEDPDFFTSRMRDEFAGVRTREDLKAFFRENSADLGRLHESAYEKFWELLIRLQEPEILLEDELDISSFSLKDVSDLYFRMHVPRQKNIKNYTYLQKMTKKNWPDYSELQRMKSRTADVSRKVILLLFLITGDFLEEEEMPDGGEECDGAVFGCGRARHGRG